MHKRERYFAMLNDNRVVRPFEWGTEFVNDAANGDDPRKVFSEFSRQTIENSEAYFAGPAIDQYFLSEPPAVAGGLTTNSGDAKLQPPAVAGGLTTNSGDAKLQPPAASSGLKSNGGDAKLQPPAALGGLTTNSGDAKLQPPATAGGSDRTVLTWQSSVTTPSRENNTAYAAFFPHETSKRSAVVILPHWNAKAGTYFDLCRYFNRVGLSALRLTLPYHEERMPPDLERADHLVAPNVGRTLQSIRQSVSDTRAAVAWLKGQGYEKVGVVGTSIGSCVAFLAFVHDLSIDAAVFNHVSGYMADVVWNGLSTYHVRDGFGDNIELDELREYWLPVSPMAYMAKLSKQPARPQRYIYTLYDLSFPVDLTRDTMRALQHHKIEHSRSAIPCGHYTLGEKPWVYLDGYKIISYLRKHLK